MFATFVHWIEHSDHQSLLQPFSNAAVIGLALIKLIFSSCTYTCILRSMGGRKAVEATVPPSKRTKGTPAPTAEEIAVQAAKLAASDLAEAKKQDQRLLAATCTKPGATDAQKAMYLEYKAAPRFGAVKDDLLKRFLADKKCQWYQTLERIKTESHNATNSGLKGYGTRPLVLCLFCYFLGSV